MCHVSHSAIHGAAGAGRCHSRTLAVPGSAELSVLHVGSKDNVADILTKPLAHSDFQ